MSLHGKFRFLLAIFGISVVANVLVSVWCIHIYMGEATNRFQLLMFSARDTEEIRRLLDDLTAELRERGQRDSGLHDTRYRHLHEKIAARIAELRVEKDDTDQNDVRRRLGKLATHLSQACDRYVDLLNNTRRAEAEALLTGEIIPRYLEPLDRRLSDCARGSDVALTQTSADVASKQASVTAILGVNALAAFLLAAAGVHLVRNWVLKPVDALKAAVETHASGDLAYRISGHSNDELGTLSQALNRMADSLIEIQDRLVQQQRLAAIGEVASTIAHNIRNPLAGIRASAQALLMELPEDSPDRARHEQMIETVDSLSRWLRELLMVSRPIDLDPRPAEIGEIVERVTSVMQSDTQRRGIRFEFRQPQEGCRAQVDAPRLEQALLAVVDNAVDASPADSVVRIEVRRDAESPRWVELLVVDSGPGIDPDVLQRIATPYFSTKPGGTGIGLHLARRITEAHGGAIEFHNNADGGTKVVLRLPAARGSVQGA